MSPKPEQSTTDSSNGQFTEKFKEIVRSSGIKDTVSEVIIKDAGLKGEGFASLTQYVTVKFENPQVKPLNLFVKVHTPNASHTEMIEELKAFEKEATFLCDYVAAAKEMCKRKGRDGYIDFYPKCYYGDEKMTVLENLVVDKGYEMIDKEIRQDLEAAKVSIVTLAKHHAISHVMIKESGSVNSFFAKFPNLDYEIIDKPIFATMLEPSFDNSIKSNGKILEMSKDVEGAESAAIKLKSFLGKPMGILIDTLKEQGDDNLLVLCHGDYWNNNMMFLKDKETNRIVHHMAIDLQITRYNSALVDVGYYLFTSVQTKVRQNHLHELLELYRNTLISVSKDFGHPINVTYEQLFREFQKKFSFGFWIGMTIACGPVMAIMKQVDISEIDMKDWVNILDRLINKWIDENPDKTADSAKELVSLMREFEELTPKNL